MSDGDGDLVANFMAITGADDSVAIQMLEAANFSLEDAVNLFFASEGAVGAGREGSGSASQVPAGGGSARAQPGPGGGDPENLEDTVRAPLPTKIERLYDVDPRYQYHGLSGRPPPQIPHVDAFRDFRAESAAAAQASGSAARNDAQAAGSNQGLSGLFKLPAELVFSGNAEMAKTRAAAEGKWLLINVQSATEFASLRLNRDTWSHEALKEVLKGTFVFYQTHDTTTDGQMLSKLYQLDSLAGDGAACPAILVVDPITGAQLWHRTGFIDAEKLMEELVPFMDHGPTDAGALGLAQHHMKRKSNAPTWPSATAAAAAGGSSAPLTEDEELALAISMSMERDGPGPSKVAPSADSLEDLDEEHIWKKIQEAEQQAAVAARTPELVAAEALARVPAEPADSDPDAVRVALRMPDGTRITRRFRRTDPVKVLFDLGVSRVPEAAAGRSLIIAHAMPGGQVLSDPEQSLEMAGVAGAMLAIKLAD